jgi:hypothetical protein
MTVLKHKCDSVIVEYFRRDFKPGLLMLCLIEDIQNENFNKTLSRIFSPVADQIPGHGLLLYAFPVTLGRTSLE